MSTLQILLATALIPFSVAFVLNLPRLFKAIRATRRLYLLCAAWIALALSQARFVESEKLAGVQVSLSVGDYYQIGWMVLAAPITAFLLLTTRADGHPWRLPLLALLLYAFLGAASAGFSPAPLLAFYKASQVILFAILAITTFSALVRLRQPRIPLELIYFLLTLVVASAAFGGVFFPSLAFTELFGGGAFGRSLMGVAPLIQQNELGLLAAIVVIMSVRRGFENKNFSYRFYHLSLAFLSYSVLFSTQARTSLVTVTIALVIMCMFIRRLRWLLIVAVVAGISAFSFTVVNDADLGLEESVTIYLRRGQTDKQIETMSGRTILWNIGMKMVADKPFLGHGFQTGTRYGGGKYGLGAGSNLHSAHMQVMADSGLVGYLVWLLLFIVPIAWFVIKQLFRFIPATTEDARLHVEVALVAFVILVRSIGGHVLVAHQFNLMLYVAIYLFVCTFMVLERRNVTSLIMRK